MTVLHASDLHFGRPHRHAVADALIRCARRLGPDVAVVSGDLTQRAKAREMRAARSFLARLAPVPCVVAPGNHDVPLYRVWERLLGPYRNYRASVRSELDGALDVAGAAGGPPARFVWLNSAAPRGAVVAGRLSRRQTAFAGQACRTARPDAKRVLVVHHPPSALAGSDARPPLRGGRRFAAKLPDWRVDLVLSGHEHETRLGWAASAAGAAGASVPLAIAGTATSSRGRGAEAGRCAFNLVRLEDNGLRVARYLYCEDARRFVEAGGRAYPAPSRSRRPKAPTPPPA